MTDESRSQRDDELKALIGTGPVPFPEKTRRKFQPWHRPRKQYVRNFQWSREVNFLARDLKLNNGELRYLTLPGNDLLDIRHLVRTVCQQREIQLKYLGFNSAARPSDAAQSELNSQQFSTNRLTRVAPESEVYPGDFREVGNVKSPSYERVRRTGPFHVINIDLCGGFAGQERGDGIPNYFEALQALLESQRHSHQDFLLFVTTRMDDDSVAESARERLHKVAQNIYDTCQRYASTFVEAWGLSDDDKLEIPKVVSSSEAFILGLTQWIVSRGAEAGLKASVKSFYTYRAGSYNGEDDIVSLAIRFKPQPYINEDPDGLATRTFSDSELDIRKCEQSYRIPKIVRDRVYVDEVLRTQAAEFQSCLDQSADLLTDAGYDADSYHNWVYKESDRYATI